MVVTGSFELGIGFWCTSCMAVHLEELSDSPSVLLSNTPIVPTRNN